MYRIRTVIAAAAFVLAALVPVSLAAGAAATVSGELVTDDAVVLSPDAVAVVMIVDQDEAGNPGAIIGQERIDGAQFPTAFEVPYDKAAIDPDRSYALYATIVDDVTTYESVEPVPVITGGPTSDVEVQMAEEPAPQPAVLDVSIVRTDRSALGPDAYAIAVLLRRDTATPVDSTLVADIGQEPIEAPIGYDAGLIDPDAEYVVKAGIVDGDRYWTGPAVPAISGGATTGFVEVLVKPKSAPLPTPTAEPTAPPEPSETPEPTVTPTPEPDEGLIKGKLTFREDHDLSGKAIAVVELVQGSKGPFAGKVIAVERIEDPGPEPVPYELTYDWDDVNPDKKYYLWAGIVDGDLAWVTPVGVRVKVPQPSITGMELPLQFRPDLLKATVTGTVDGADLDSTDPAAFATVSIVRLNTGETIGFQVIAPAGTAPIKFSVPYDRTQINKNETYVAMALVNDGSETWESIAGTPVITQGSPVSKVRLLVVASASPTPSPSPTASPTPTPTPTASPSPTPTPSPSASPTPEPVGETGGGVDIGLVLLVLFLIAGGGAVGFSLARARR